jgi:hypothetical protein
LNRKRTITESLVYALNELNELSSLHKAMKLNKSFR